MSVPTAEPTTPEAVLRPFMQTPPGRVLKALASLRLTVALFALSLVLVFVGTLAQMDEGIWTVVGKYFRSIYVWVPFQLFVKLGQVFLGVPTSVQVPGAFPFPGGWLIGGLLLANLLAAHLLRFRLTWKRSGVLILHAGLIVLLVGELITGLYAVEARMTIGEGETVNFVDVSNSVELALTDVTDPTADDTAVVPQRVLDRGGTIRHDALPVDVEVHEFMKNSDLVNPRRGGGENVRVSVMGEAWAIVPQPEGAGVEANQREDAPAARVTLKRKDTGEPVGTYLVSAWFYPNTVLRQRQLAFPPQTFVLDGRTYTVDLRPARVYKPYRLTLLDFKHEVYLGTKTPKNFESVVRVADAAGGDAREARIYMNRPLRIAPDGSTVGLIFSGETLYQSSFLPGDTGTVLQVVQNPGWLLPYVSCALVTLGMIVHFGMNLINFLSAQARAKA